MRRTASSVLRDLEIRIAQLEKESGSSQLTATLHLTSYDENDDPIIEKRILKGIREISQAIKDYNLTNVVSIYRFKIDSITLRPPSFEEEERLGYKHISLEIQAFSIVKKFVEDELGLKTRMSR